MSYFRIWMHVVLVTDGQEAMLNDAVASHITANIKVKAMERGILVDSVGALPEHVHFLITLGANQKVGEVVDDLKEIVGRMVDLSKLSPIPLIWDESFFAFSVSHSLLEKVREYVRGQVTVHHRKTFGEEYAEFCEKHGFTLSK